MDVTNKTSPTQLARVGYGAEGVGYTHQGWLTEDNKYFVFGDETDETNFALNTRTLVMDVQDLKNIFLAGTYISPHTAAIDHNQYIIGDLTYQANYFAGSRILRMHDLAT
ncbi:MAG: choice-of-anchor B family protein, partial [Gaiellaceae bacterium]